MFKVFQLIFSPFSAWTGIATAQRGPVYALVISLLPLLLVALGIESWGLMRSGETHGELGQRVHVSQPLALRYAGAQAVLFLASVCFSGFALQTVASSFHLRSTFREACETVIYGLLPMALLRAADAIPWMHTWICWGIGAALTTATLYHGVALMLKPEQTKGFGLYLVSVVIVLLCAALAHLLAVSVLHGKILRNF